jgi:hypothetical protein
MNLAPFVIFLHAAVATLLGLLYFRRYALARPPIGIINLWDVVIMIGGIMLVPYLYLTLPLGLVMVFIGVVFISILYFTLEPILRLRWLIGFTTLVLASADIGIAMQFGVNSKPFLFINNIALVIGVVGITNLWAQSGMKARDVAALATALAMYDFIFTSQLTLMSDLFTRLSGLPFAPMLAWPVGDGQWLALGFGDLLLAVAFPLVMRKAFSRSAAIAAITINLAALGSLFVLPVFGLLHETFPVMVLLGPLMAAQYLYWTRRQPTERTTWQYREAEA